MIILERHGDYGPIGSGGIGDDYSPIGLRHSVSVFTVMVIEMIQQCCGGYNAISILIRACCRLQIVALKHGHARVTRFELERREGEKEKEKHLELQLKWNEQSC